LPEVQKEQSHYTSSDTTTLQTNYSFTTMKLSIAVAALSLSGANAFVQSTGNAFGVRATTELQARQPIMAGNWKMNPATEEDAVVLAAGLAKYLGDETCPISDDEEGCTEVVVFPPFPFISKVRDIAADAGITVGAQSIYFQDKGAYTGSVAASMVQSIGCEYVLCGHSERRVVFNDGDESINRKVQKVLSSGMKPILCIGETKDEYDLNIKNEVCAMQLSKDLLGVTKEQMADVVIAYEPVWAIGTGLVCGAEDASTYDCIVLLMLVIASFSYPFWLW
jgi:triosephosphate isomerase